MTARIVRLRYPTASEVTSSPTASIVRLAMDAARAEVGFAGRVRDPELLRDALLCAVDLRESDLRYRGRDRTAYLAYLMKKGKKASAAIWEAQKAFLDAQYGEAQQRPRGLDPVLTVDPDEVSLEVFSKDESAWARLAFANGGFEGRAAVPGTAACDLSERVVDRLLRVRTYQPLDLEIGTTLTSSDPVVAEAPREVELPDDWLRGFLQVQSAATLPAAVASMRPVDLYNLLYSLRVRRAKKAPRALRFELVPEMRPRVVIEPWETVFECHGEPYAGRMPRVVRMYGRQRLLALWRVLPHVRGARVHLLGPGLPSFWVLDLGEARLTVALTSWSESKWASTASFDALMPGAGASEDAERAVLALRSQGPLALPELARELELPPEETRTALQRACLRGQVLFDIDRGTYRPRSLLPEPVDDAAIRYGSPREALAHRLLGDPAGGADAMGEVRVTKLHVMVGEGQQVEGEVMDRQLQRTFSPRFTLDLEGQVTDAWCNCPTYLRSKLREGPCEHMIALFVRSRRDADEAERLRSTPEGRMLVRAESRLLSKRDGDGARTEYRVSLDDRVVRIAVQAADPGRPLGDPRHLRTWYDTDLEAREAYFERLDRLAAEGFIDTGAASA
jgi:hypothetical protein